MAWSLADADSLETTGVSNPQLTTAVLPSGPLICLYSEASNYAYSGPGPYFTDGVAEFTHLGQFNAGGNETLDLWRATWSDDGESHTIVCPQDNTSRVIAIGYAIYSPTAGKTIAYDTQDDASGTSTNPTLSGLTVSNNNSLVVGAMAGDLQYWFYTPSGGTLAFEESFTGNTSEQQYRLESAGSVNVSWTCGSSAWWIVGAAVFYEVDILNVTGTGGGTLDDVQVDAAGEVTGSSHGTADITLDDVTLSATGNVAYGSASITIAGIRVRATGVVPPLWSEQEYVEMDFETTEELEMDFET